MVDFYGFGLNTVWIKASGLERVSPQPQNPQNQSAQKKSLE